MQKEVKKSWALFIGIGVMMIAHGLQMQIMGIRSVLENFSVFTTGIFMSGYFVGYFVGSKTTPNFVSKVGHIRVFAAFASLASLSALVAVVYVNPFMWTISRFITGISLVSCYVVTESWLNDRATNKNRGQLLSAYMMVIYFGLAIGMLLLNVSKPEDYEPFILVSILLSVALVPILLTKRPAPKFKKIETISIKELYKISPLGSLSSFFTGIIHAAFFSLISVYATLAKFSLIETSILLFIATIAGVIGQGPIGYFSDKFDRRKVIVFTSFGAAFFALLLIFSSGTMYLPQGLGSSKIWFYFFVILFSFCSLPLFSLILAHTNDYITKDKFVAAGASLQFAFGFGAMSGPFLCSIFMNVVGNNGFFIFIIIFHSIIGIFGIHRMKVRPTLENPDSQFVPMPQTITPVGMELNPSTEHIDEPYTENVEKMLKRKGVILKKKAKEITKEN